MRHFSAKVKDDFMFHCSLYLAAIPQFSRKFLTTCVQSCKNPRKSAVFRYESGRYGTPSQLLEISLLATARGFKSLSLRWIRTIILIHRYRGYSPFFRQNTPRTEHKIIPSCFLNKNSQNYLTICHHSDLMTVL